MGNKFNKHVVVVGSARSGTSWLSELMAQPFRYRMLFEPDQETRTKRGHLLCDRWLRSPTDSKEAYTYLKAIFKNLVDCDWIAQNSNRKWKRHLWPFVPKKYIIKFVRCNLSAPFIHNEFGIPVIHLIRNPYDVIRSQQQVRFPWLYDLSYFAEQEKLVTLIKDKFSYDITQFETLTDVEKLALRWCIENVIPLEVLEPYSGKAEVVRYEALSNNIQLFSDLCAAFGLEPVANLERHFKQPSSKTHPESVFLQKGSDTNKLSTAERIQINKILDVFKTQLYAKQY